MDEKIFIVILNTIPTFSLHIYPNTTIGAIFKSMRLYIQEGLFEDQTVK